ncbi:FecR family protein [Mangrovibacterium diazotrophicum]|uniref:FecR family protein n=1 Tax=Mangrovibacterium diazotrophicum TaxID=1261403 RepID=A0A419W8L5_9BACT|nr:FecR domain-containing protein [Mangrovibacterium diazotrophicum]RKD91823.1 FecR family protein [Mangrovibacterium diazotrophicum]
MEDLKKILDNFFNGKYTRKEYFSIQREFEKEKADENFLSALEQQWQTIDDDDKDFPLLKSWNSLVYRLELSPASKRRQLNYLVWLQRAAAILFIPLAISFLLYYISSNIGQSAEESWAEIICPPGVRAQFHLPDGSSGVLNSDSKLKYAVNFSSNRKVELVGQAYFEVVKDKKHPFNVTTSQLNVEVLGTTFSVLAYPDEQSEEVVLKTGQVKVLDTNLKPLTLLSPDQQLVFDIANSRYVKKEVDASALVSWINGKLVFRNERFEDIASQISRWYHVEIEVVGQKLKDYRYYGTFENESLDEVLRLIKLTAPIKYQEVERVKQPDGTFSNRKIILMTDERRIGDF